MDEIFRISDRVSVLRDGEMIATQACRDTSIDAVIRQMVGRTLTIHAREQSVPRGKELLVARKISTAKLRDVTFSVHRGEILGVAGLVASGRSELGRALFGLSRLHAGEFLLDGLPYRPRSPREAIAHGIALVPEDRQKEGLVPGISIGHNATLASLPKLARRGWIMPREEAAAANSALVRTRTKYGGEGLAVRTLSGGNQQKVLIGKWLLTHPRLCFLDDPRAASISGPRTICTGLSRNSRRRALG